MLRPLRSWFEFNNKNNKETAISNILYHTTFRSHVGSVDRHVLLAGRGQHTSTMPLVCLKTRNAGQKDVTTQPNLSMQRLPHVANPVRYIARYIIMTLRNS
jgi:hypothetical protein